MAILKPSNISPNNIVKDAQQDIAISWKNLGDRQYAYRVIVYTNTDNQLIYDTGKVSNLNPIHIIPANTLVNGVVYKYTITVWNQLNQSATSDWIIFKCSSMPIASFVNISPNDEVLNSSYLFVGSYYQAEDVPIRSWRMILYDEHDAIIGLSPETFSDVIEYEFSGLRNDTDYQIELQVRSQDNLINTTGKIPFHVRYEVPSSSISLQAENVAEKAAVRLQWRVIQIIGEVVDGTISFIDGDKIDLTHGTIIFQDGMPNFREFNLKLWLLWKDLKNTVITKQIDTCIGTVNWNIRDGTTEILRLKSPLGDIWLEWVYENDTQGRFYLKKNFYGVSYFICTDLLEFTEGDIVYIGIDYRNNLCDIYIEKGGDVIWHNHNFQNK